MDKTPCSLSDRAWAERVEAWRALEAAVTSRTPTAAGVDLVYRLDASVAAELAALVDAERRCCGSVTFEGSVVVRIEAPDSVRPWVRRTFLGPPRS